MFVGGYAAVQPADGAVHGFLHAGVVGRGGSDDIVELHDYVGADGILQGDGVFGCEEPVGSLGIKVGGEEEHGADGRDLI